ncbi:hypothetical protein PoB_004708200 [Plakobranchus ocellatus]|uniref:Mutator-like transposase domain-containing protein n=1 Tax=Plakobranchus ocellatus TaxID=259542 RepID=A0AAV4BMF6_9GAST|nr:hypothetical protein PoB_004708200 [Plakobranchus ocellatus]
MVSDGDSKAFNKLLEVLPYGPDVVILKEDCINHVGKRLGTALRNLVADCSKKGITLGGRGYGRLTAETIWKLQIYYSMAIRSGRSAEEMRYRHSGWLLPWRVEFALLSAAAERNSGPTALSTIKTMLGFQEGEHGQRLGQARERKRVYKSSFEQQQKAKARKKKDSCSQGKGTPGKGS